MNQSPSDGAQHFKAVAASSRDHEGPEDTGAGEDVHGHGCERPRLTDTTECLQTRAASLTTQPASSNS